MSLELEFAEQAFASRRSYPMTGGKLLAYTAGGQATGKGSSAGDDVAPILSIVP